MKRQGESETMKKVNVDCPSCGGDGLYKSHTPYTINGVPVCFRCKGVGKIRVSPKRFPASGPHTKLAIVTISDGTKKLIPFHQKTWDWSHYEEPKRTIDMVTV